MNSQQIEVILRRNIFQKIFTQNILNVVFRKLESTIKEIIIKRTQSGIDFYGRDFGEYNQQKRGKKKGKAQKYVPYDKVKAQKYAARESGLTKYASTSSEKKLQLTGNTFSAIDCKLKGKVTITNYRATGRFDIFVNNVSGRNEQKIVEGLQSTTGVKRNKRTYSKKAWCFLGLSYSGSNVESEQKQLQQQLIKALKEKYPITIKIK